MATDHIQKSSTRTKISTMVNIPAEYKKFADKRRKQYGVPQTRTIAFALDYAFKHREDWDHFFEK